MMRLLLSGGVLFFHAFSRFHGVYSVKIVKICSTHSMRSTCSGNGIMEHWNKTQILVPLVLILYAGTLEQNKHSIPHISLVEEME